MVKIIETACVENTNRIARQTINAPLRREENTQSPKLRAMTDLCDRRGKEAEEYREQRTQSVPESYGRNSETGLPQEGTPLPEGMPPPSEESEGTPDGRIARLIPAINERREGRARIPEESKKPYSI